VVNSWPKLRFINPPASGTTLRGARFRTPRNGMIVKAAHQMPALSREILTASSVSADMTESSPKLNASRMPPPR
jgi:hypothetical protein